MKYCQTIITNILVFSLASFINNLHAGDVIVTKISFIGSELTRDHVLRREIQHQIGNPLDSVLLDQDQLRLENLQLFSLVTWQAYQQSDTTCEVRFFLVETWRILPGLAPVYDEKTGWSLSGLLIINNFRGLNQSIQLSGIIGGITSYSIQFHDPWIMGDRISLQTEFQNQRFEHYFLPYRQRLLTAQIKIGKDYYYRHKLRARLKISDSSYSSDSLKIANFRYILPLLTYAFDTRNLYSDPFSGGLLSASVTLGLAPEQNDQHYSRIDISISRFVRLAGTNKRLVAAFNIKTGLRQGYQDEFSLEYLGGAYTVRGWQPPDRELYSDLNNHFRFGHQTLTTSFELRQTIIPKFATALRNESGLSIVAFLDCGVVAHQPSELLEQTPLIGTGFGIRIPSPMIGQLRLDYGWGFYSGKSAGKHLHLAFNNLF
ncbi:MAG: BamA/TamA family outer membrane protein [Candidatus Marinimicrobia bacterium]|nr:BamA/TamA family outer membrane protein [Candidatus Neomarinimicrobiota bacterium]